MAKVQVSYFGSDFDYRRVVEGSCPCCRCLLKRTTRHTASCTRCGAVWSAASPSGALRVHGCQVRTVDGRLICVEASIIPAEGATPDLVEQPWPGAVFDATSYESALEA